VVGVGLAASGCAGALTGVDFTATFAESLAFLDDPRRRGALFDGFFLIDLGFLTVAAFLRVIALVAAVFLRLALALRFTFRPCRHYNYPGRLLVMEQSLPNKMASQRTSTDSKQ
jgi:hypothetical protein